MSFLDSFDISASGMSAQRVRLDVAAENIANVDTTRTASGGPYRRKDVVLESYGQNTSFANALRQARTGQTVISSGKRGVRVGQIVEDTRSFKKVYNPSHPDADQDGYVEMPNVDVLKETVDSMSATRSYEANVTALNAMKQMIAKAEEIGK
ncbi:MAG: flagellar basal body rod protein FlgC [Eubacterium sp.]|nr:flagellar basal body rod protein FlgC [Eubacterium sp.]